MFTFKRMFAPSVGSLEAHLILQKELNEQNCRDLYFGAFKLNLMHYRLNFLLIVAQHIIKEIFDIWL